MLVTLRSAAFNNWVHTQGQSYRPHSSDQLHAQPKDCGTETISKLTWILSVKAATVVLSSSALDFFLCLFRR